jgi:hypothetical protein
MSNLICEYCNKTYSSKSSLNNHQKSTKKCLEIQSKLNKENIISEYNCQYCLKNFSTKQNLKIHENSCLEKKNFEIKELKEKYEKDIQELKEKHENDIQELKDKHSDEINELKNDNKNYLEEIQKLRENMAEMRGELKSSNKASDCVYEIAKQPKNITNNSSNTNTNNSNTNNSKTLNITSSIDFKNIDKVKEIIDKNYDINHILGGQKGAAQFAAKYLLLDENGKYVYICSDPSRNSFKYKNENGEIEKDLEAKKLSNYLVDGGIHEKAKDLSLNWCIEDGKINQDKFMFVTDKQISIMNIKDNNTEFKKELASIVS